METSASTKNLLVKSLFILGIFVVVVILAFAMIRIIPMIFSSFANVDGAFSNNRAASSLRVEVDRNRVNSGEAIFVNWEYEPTVPGFYEIEFTCANDLTMEIGTSEGNKIIECDTVYNLNPTSQTLSILPTLARENSLEDTQFKIRYVSRDGQIKRSDIFRLTVVKRAEAGLAGSGQIIETEMIQTAPAQQTQQTSVGNQGATETETTTQSVVAETRPVAVAPALPDFRIHDLMAIGDTTIVFTVSNIGNVATGQWFFNYATPDGDVLSSPTQPSLLPGQGIRYTLRLEDVPAGDVAIAVDPRNLVRESNVLNNIGVIRIRGDWNNRDWNHDWNRINLRPDLEITNLEVGRMSGSRFIADAEISERDIAAIRFVVRNIGGESTGTWRFEVLNTPFINSDPFLSARQTSLRPGERKEIIVEFDRPDEGRYNIRVELDPRNEIREESTRNNSASRSMRVWR